MSRHDIFDKFRAAMCEAGITPPSTIEPDGKLHRYHLDGDKRGSKNGWYLLHLDNRPAGVFGSWKTGSRTTWALDGKRLDRAEWARFAKLIEAAKAQAEFDRMQQQESHARAALLEWGASEPADAAHPYLVTKQVKPHFLRQRNGMLIVPLFDMKWNIWNVQRIFPDGVKRFRSGRMKGLFSHLGDFNQAPHTLLICEGWATGATLHEETGHPVFCAMYTGNLLPVAQAARGAWPDVELVICADNDRLTEGNPGLTFGMKAAKAVGARLSAPQFPEGVAGSDFNDLALFRRGGGNHA